MALPAPDLLLSIPVGPSIRCKGMLPELLVMHLALPLMDHEYAVHNATSAAGGYATDAAGSSRRICFCMHGHGSIYCNTGCWVSISS